MGTKADLATFLNHLPAVDRVDERKALLTFTGPAELGIYLNWEGSNVQFTERLLEELSRRGKATLSGFLAGLLNAPHVANNVDRQTQLVALSGRVDALDEVGFRAEFPVPVAGGQAVPAQPPDPSMLAATVIGEVLVPYYKLGEDTLGQQAGPRAVALGKRMAGKVEAALGGDPAAAPFLPAFKQSPELLQVGMLGILKNKLTSDPALAGELAGVLASAAAEPERGGLQALVEVSQKIGVVKGDVVGAVVGYDVLKDIGAKIGVTQTADTVEAGASLVGAVVGNAGPVTIGGQHHQGDNINTGGGAFFGGNVHAGGDVTGRDRVVHGDQVGGDQITAGDISGTGIAIGRGAQASVQQGLSAADLDRLFAPLMSAVASAPPDKQVQAVQAANDLKAEVAKGDEADDSRMAALIDDLVKLVPGAVSAVISMFATPVVGGLAGNVTKFVLDRLKG
jgi:hypothetical protein